MVSVDDLVLFLKTEGHPIPKILLENVGAIYSHPFRPFKRCWEYWVEDFHGERCMKCSVFNNQINECFTASKNPNHRCHINCQNCEYFTQFYGQLVAFVHQLEKPAAIFKNLYIWSGNEAWAELCGMGVEETVGSGIEDFNHSDSFTWLALAEKRS